MKIRRLFLFLLCVFLYNVNRREISSMDTLPSRYLPVSIIREFNLDLDEFPNLYEASKRFGYRSSPEYDCPYYLRKINGNYYSNYTPLIPVLAVPIYLVPLLAGMPVNERTVDMLSKFTASLFAGLSVLVLYMTLIRMTKEKTAFLVACTYAFATSVWSTASQGLWTHGPMILFMSLCAYCLIRGLEEEKYVPYSAIPLGLAVLSRQNSIVIAAVLALYVLAAHRKYFMKFAGILAIFAGLLIGYNVYLFGHISGGSYYLQQNHHIIYYGLEGKGIWSANMLEGLAGLFINPNRGLFIFSPVLVFGFLGMFYALRNREKILYLYFCVSIITCVLFLSKFSAWWGGHCFGPRYLTDILPLLCILMVFAMERVLKNGILLAIFQVLFAYSVLVQLAGVFIYPSGWNYALEDDRGLHREMLWKLKDSELVWCARTAFLDRRFLLEREKAGIRNAANTGLFLPEGGEIDFSRADSIRYLGYGWSKPEEWGAWATGPESVLRVAFGGAGSKRMIIKARSFRRFGKKQVMGIYLGNSLLKQHEFGNLNTGFESIEVGIPGKLLGKGVRELKFTYGHFKRAAMNDLRIIAAGFESVKFLPG